MKKIQIKIQLPDADKCLHKHFTILGTIVDADKQVTDHDIYSALFAIEFASNVNSMIPMRVHISDEGN